MLTTGKAETMTRAGFAARGVMYFLIGFLAAFNGRREDGAGALKFLDQGNGKMLLGAMAAGFLGYGIWRLSEAMADTEGHGSKTKGILIRLGGAGSGLIHLGLSVFAAKLALGQGGASGDATQKGAATALDLPGGQILIIAAAAVLIGIGSYQLIKAYRAGFLRHLDPTAARQPWIRWMGRAGYAARGFVFLIMGWFLWRSAQEEQASEAGGMAEALGSLPPTLEMAVAAGLLLFGLFSLVEARYRRINDPHVLERLRAAV